MGLDGLRSRVLFIEENGKAYTRTDELPNVVKDFTEKCQVVIQELKSEVETVVN
jgi:hypothetical protein